MSINDDKNIIERAWALSDGARQRLRAAVTAAGGVTAVSAKIPGMPRVTLSNIVNGHGDVGAARLEAICEKVGISVDFVLTGVEPFYENTAFVPMVLDAMVSAGPGAEPIDFDDYEPVPFPAAWLKMLGDPKELAIIRVIGDSMAPKIAHGDMVMFDRSRRGGSDGYYVVRYDGQMLVKRISFFDSVIRLRSESQLYDTIELSYEKAADPAVFEIVGKVVWVGKRFD